eukprot:9556643-Lingulodinium_polyedra.AAC.1
MFQKSVIVVKPDDMEGPLQFFVCLYEKQQPMELSCLIMRPREVELRVDSASATSQDLSQSQYVFDLTYDLGDYCSEQEVPAEADGGNL